MSGQSKYIEGLGLRHSRPRMNPNVNLAELKLSPQEFFFIAHVDGNTTYGQLCSLSGLDEKVAAEVLTKLKQRKIILAEGEPIPPKVEPRHHAPTPVKGVSLKDVIKSRAAQTKTAATAGGDHAAENPDAAKSGADTSILERLDDHAPVDALLVAEAPALEELFKLRVLRAHRRLGELSPYDLLGVPHDADRKALKRGYFNASKEFHPDRYYGKDIGPYRQFLADLFAQTKRGFEALMAMDDKKRAEFNALLEKRARLAAAARRPR